MLAVAGMGVVFAMGALTVVSDATDNTGDTTLAKTGATVQATPSAAMTTKSIAPAVKAKPNVPATPYAGGHWPGMKAFKGKDWPGMGNFAGGHNGKGGLS